MNSIYIFCIILFLASFVMVLIMLESKLDSKIGYLQKELDIEKVRSRSMTDTMKLIKVTNDVWRYHTILLFGIIEKVGDHDEVVEELHKIIDDTAVKHSLFNKYEMKVRGYNRIN